jgi:serine/threonine-protein kinase RsbW
MSSAGDQGDRAHAREDAPHTEPGRTRNPLHVTLAAVPVSASLARDLVRRWLRVLCWPPGQLGDIVLAVNEAVSNCIEHAYQSDVPGLVRIEGRVLDAPEARRVELIVYDHGSWRPVPPPEEHRRRGIPLMHACMENVVVDGSNRGTRVALRSRTVPQTAW